MEFSTLLRHLSVGHLVVYRQGPEFFVNLVQSRRGGVCRFCWFQHPPGKWGVLGWGWVPGEASAQVSPLGA